MNLTDDSANQLAQRLYMAMKEAPQPKALRIFNAAMKSPAVREEVRDQLQKLINGDHALRTLVNSQTLSPQGGRRKSNRRRSKRSRRSRRNNRR